MSSQDGGLRFVVLLSCIMVWGSASPAAAQRKDWKISGSVTYERGDFGTGTETTTVYIPTVLKRYFDKGDVSLVVPYLHIEGSGAVVTVDGVPQRSKKEPKGTGASGTGSTTAATTVSNGGIGDVLLKGSYYLLEATAQPLDLAAVAKIKFPTASHSRNLGTGKFDEGFGAEASKRILKDWTLFSDVYYTILGTPAGADTFRNQFTFDIGAGYQIISPLNLSLFFEQKTAIVAGTSAPRDVNLNAEYQLTHEFRLFGTALAGLSDGSSDYGLTAGVSLRF
jgi:Putative MetA-pathway of phenol degradation